MGAGRTGGCGERTECVNKVLEAEEILVIVRPRVRPYGRLANVV